MTEKDSRYDIARKILIVKHDLEDLIALFRKAHTNNELEFGDHLPWDVVVKAYDTLHKFQPFVDKHYFGR